MQRRLAAIMVADIVGYSSLMEEAEEQTADASRRAARSSSESRSLPRRPGLQHRGRRLPGGVRKPHQCPALRDRDPQRACRRSRRWRSAEAALRAPSRRRRGPRRRSRRRRRERGGAHPAGGGARHHLRERRLLRQRPAQFALPLRRSRRAASQEHGGADPHLPAARRDGAAPPAIRADAHAGCRREAPVLHGGPALPGHRRGRGPAVSGRGPDGRTDRRAGPLPPPVRQLAQRQLRRCRTPIRIRSRSATRCGSVTCWRARSGRSAIRCGSASRSRKPRRARWCGATRSCGPSPNCWTCST